MFNKLGPIDICCDAPPYSIVQACNMIGMQDPEDVRWLRLSAVLGEDDYGHAGEKRGSLSALFGLGKPGRSTCTCGAQLPELQKYLFTFLTGKEMAFLLAQCGKC